MCEFSELLLCGGEPKEAWRNALNLSIKYVKSNYVLKQILDRHLFFLLFFFFLFMAAPVAYGNSWARDPT